MDRIFLCRTKDVKLNSSKRFLLPGKIDIALFHTASGFHAIKNSCPHAGARLDDGFLEGHLLMCVWHGWKFNLKSRKCITMEGSRLKGYELAIEDEQIFVLI